MGVNEEKQNRPKNGHFLTLTTRRGGVTPKQQRALKEKLLRVNLERQRARHDALPVEVALYTAAVAAAATAAAAAPAAAAGGPAAAPASTSSSSSAAAASAASSTRAAGGGGGCGGGLPAAASAPTFEEREHAGPSPSALFGTCLAIECEARAAEAALVAAPADASTLAVAARLRESIAAGRPWLVKNGVLAVVLTGDEGLALQRSYTTRLLGLPLRDSRSP